MAARNVVKALPAWRQAIGKWAYNISYFPQIGLMADDTLYETDVVKEAIRRLPQNVQDERQFRIARACMLSNTKTVLPKEEWSKYEEDIKYLQPYIADVEKEMKEKWEWSKQ